jgi:beta-lactamase class A
VHAAPVVESPAREVRVGADERVVMGSVYKLPLLVALCRQFDAGVLDPTAPVRIHPASCTPGPTGIAAFLDPVTLSWRDLAASMIVVSNNAAADMILGQIGLATVHETLAAATPDGTTVVRRTPTDPPTCLDTRLDSRQASRRDGVA